MAKQHKGNQPDPRPTAPKPAVGGAPPNPSTGDPTPPAAPITAAAEPAPVRAVEAPPRAAAPVPRPAEPAAKPVEHSSRTLDHLPKAHGPKAVEHGTYADIPTEEPIASHGHHIIETRVYFIVFAWLMVLLVVTLGAAWLNLGPLNLPIAVTIAVIKAVIVVLYFMHVRYSSHLVRFFAGATFFWLALMFVLTLSDYATRR